ncbi:glycosyl hydrolase family 28-related protein [Microbacterium sp. LWH11-1.2]|uniref:glycosyl hydrolase family 28-related protein n=1 Tax=Microbacterium sp. LWH11-1.2 TaxID=3135258 RepID=UPI003139E569
MVNRLVAVDDADYKLPDPVLAALSVDVANPATVVGGALAEAFVGPLDATVSGPKAPLVYRNVDDFGAVGDATTDDRAAIQAALDAAGVGGRVLLSPHKRYRVAGTLITQTWQTLEGAVGAFGSGASTSAELVFAVSGSTPGIRARSYTKLKNLLIRGPGDAVGTCVGVKMYDSSANSLRMENVSVDDWAIGVHLDQVYYGLLLNPAFRRCGTGIKITSSLNIAMHNPQINTQRADGTVGIGIDGCARPLSIFGGSIEQFQSGIKVFHSESLNLFGVYFESTIASANVRGIDTAAFINTTINAIGCYIYTPNLTTWIEQRGGTGRVLNCRGNSFIAGAASANVSGSAAYRFTVGQNVDITGDNWVRVETALTSYTAVDGGGLPYPGARVEIPVGYTAGGSVPGTILDGKLRLQPVEAKTHAVAGVATINPDFGNTEITVSANVTSMNLTAVGSHRQELILTIVQDATGGRTYVYPSNFRFAGGVAPSDTTASTRTTVRMQYNGVLNRWFEVSRTVAVPVT